jgi:hypothetical protein
MAPALGKKGRKDNNGTSILGDHVHIFNNCHFPDYQTVIKQHQNTPRKAILFIDA